MHFAIPISLAFHNGRECGIPVELASVSTSEGVQRRLSITYSCTLVKYLHVHVQVLAKSCKMIPVMLMGTLIGGKFYSSLEYGCAIMIAAGISVFAQQSSSKVISKLVAPNAPLGYGLCTLNLLFDGYTNAMQVCRCVVNLGMMSLGHSATINGIAGRCWKWLQRECCELLMLCMGCRM